MCVFVCAMEGIGEDIQPEMLSLSTVSVAQSQQYMSDAIVGARCDINYAPLNLRQ